MLSTNVAIDLHQDIPCVVQCVAVCCSVLQCVAVCCSAFKTSNVLTRHQSRHFSLDQDIVVLKTCSTASSSSSLTICSLATSLVPLETCDAVCCSVLQCAAVCCSVLQCDAVCCSVLQCTVVCWRVLQCVLQCVLQRVLQC